MVLTNKGKRYHLQRQVKVLKVTAAKAKVVRFAVASKPSLHVQSF